MAPRMSRSAPSIPAHHSAAQSFTLKNTGTANLAVQALKVDGSHAADFTVSGPAATTLAPGASTVFTVTFKPGATGARSAAIHIASNDADENPFDISLSGTGNALPVPGAPEIAIANGSDSGRWQRECRVRLARSRHTVGRPVIHPQKHRHRESRRPSPQGGWQPCGGFHRFRPGRDHARPGSQHGFHRHLQTRRHRCPQRGDPHRQQRCGRKPLRHFPQRNRQRPACARRAGNRRCQRHGADLPDGTANVAFGSLDPGTSSAAQSFTLKNTGTANLSGPALKVDGSHAADFTVSGPAATTLAPGASTVFTVTFKPGAAGARSAAIHIASNDADENPFDISLSGTGNALPEPGVPRIEVWLAGKRELTNGLASLQFGTSTVGTPGDTKTITLFNRGSAALTGLAIEKTGANKTDFIIPPLRVSSLAPGKSLSFKITFKPSAVHNRRAVVRIRSNDPADRSFLISLTGKGKPNPIVMPAVAGRTAFAVPATPDRPVVSFVIIGGEKYRCITIPKSDGMDVNPYAVEVSPNLVNWYSGPNHTTVIWNNASVLQVRDDTPLKPGSKRFIRLRKRS